MLPERQEPVDDGDGRVGQIVRIAPRAASAPRPRLAWRPWMRGLVLGLAVGLLAGAALALLWARHEFNAAVSGIERTR